MAKVPSVLVVDQDPDRRFALQQLVREARFSSAGGCGLGTEAVAQAVDAKPDVILCGMREPLARAIQTIEALAHALPQTPIVVYADSADLELARRAMFVGARDFLAMPVAAETLGRSLGAALESEERRRLRQNGGPVLGPQGTIIVVFGAKGGVGKTAVAANLAVAMARAHQAVTLVDADDSFGDAAAVLSLHPELTIVDALRDGGSDRWEQAMVDHGSGLAVLAGPEDPLQWNGVSGPAVQTLLQTLARRFDIVVVDTGGVLNEFNLALLQAASMVLWVTSTEYASVRDSVQALQVLRRLGAPEDSIRLLLNQTSGELDVRPDAIEEAIGLPVFWTIPYDHHLRRATQQGEAVVEMSPHSLAARSLRDLATVLLGGPLERAESGVRNGATLGLLGLLKRGQAALLRRRPS